MGRNGDTETRSADIDEPVRSADDGVRVLLEVVMAAIAWRHRRARRVAPNLALGLAVRARCDGLAATLDEDVALERILPREALVAVSAGERLDCEVDALVPLKVVIAVEALRALVALERPVIGRGALALSLCVRSCGSGRSGGAGVVRGWGAMVEVRSVQADGVQAGGVPAVEAQGHAWSQRAVDELHLARWVLHVRQHGPREWVLPEGTLVGVR